jgi:hypothetical protein
MMPRTLFHGPAPFRYVGSHTLQSLRSSPRCKKPPTGAQLLLFVSTQPPGDIMVRKTAVAAGLLIAASSADAFSGAGRVSTPSLRSSVVSARPAARHMGGVTMQDSTPNRSDISARAIFAGPAHPHLRCRIGMAIPSAWVEKDQYSLGGPVSLFDPCLHVKILFSSPWTDFATLGKVPLAIARWARAARLFAALSRRLAAWKG